MACTNNTGAKSRNIAEVVDGYCPPSHNIPDSKQTLKSMVNNDNQVMAYRKLPLPAAPSKRTNKIFTTNNNTACALRQNKLC
jgi:hypothetical protein